MTAYMPKSKTDKWATPPEVYNPLNEEFKFNYDPCPIEWQEGDADGLLADWGTSTFCNPPYSSVAKWIAKAHAEWKKGKTVVMLINAVTDTKAFHKYIYGQAELRFIKGRVKFINPLEPTKSQPSPKPSMLVVFEAPIKSTRRLKSSIKEDSCSDSCPHGDGPFQWCNDKGVLEPCSKKTFCLNMGLCDCE